jgi:hypothetical protein
MTEARKQQVLAEFEKHYWEDNPYGDNIYQSAQCAWLACAELYEAKLAPEPTHYQPTRSRCADTVASG